MDNIVIREAEINDAEEMILLTLCPMNDQDRYNKKYRNP